MPKYTQDVSLEDRGNYQLKKLSVCQIQGIVGFEKRIGMYLPAAAKIEGITHEK